MSKDVRTVILLLIHNWQKWQFSQVLTRPLFNTVLNKPEMDKTAAVESSRSSGGRRSHQNSEAGTPQEPPCLAGATDNAQAPGSGM